MIAYDASNTEIPKTQKHGGYRLFLIKRAGDVDTIYHGPMSYQPDSIKFYCSDISNGPKLLATLQIRNPFSSNVIIQLSYSMSLILIDDLHYIFFRSSFAPFTNQVISVLNYSIPCCDSNLIQD